MGLTIRWTTSSAFHRWCSRKGLLAKTDVLAKSQKSATPANAGAHNDLEYLDFRVRGNDGKRAKRTLFNSIKN